MVPPPNLNGVPHVSYVYVYAENSTTSLIPDQTSLPASSPNNSLTILVNVVRRYDSMTGNSFRDHNSTHIFQHPFDLFESAPSSESNAIFSNMLSAIEIPFPFENLYWKNPNPNPYCRDRGRLQLNYLNDMHRMISEVAGQTVRAGLESGSWMSGLSICVTIENMVMVPYWVINSLHHLSAQEMLSEHERRRRGTSPTELRSFIQVQVLAPAAKASVEALDKFRYDDDDVSSKEFMTCPICMEEVLSGAQLIRMPCSHRFHGDCILTWLKSRHTCPLCRFKLPTLD